jgi:hypothetical protein
MNRSRWNFSGKILRAENMTENEKENLPLISLPIISFFVFVGCIICANFILPEYCSLFSSNIESGFACDGMTFGDPQPCAYCRDKGTALAATIIAGFGFVSFFTPFLVFFLKDIRSRPVKQTKLFD